MAPLQTRCRHHPERAGIGVCTRCGSTLCEECSTRVEGILHCRLCLFGLQPAAQRSAWRSASALAPALLLTPLAWAGLGLGLYLLVASIALVGEWLRSLNAT